jgi:MYXO-CTERM domain-containing protein
LQTNYCGSYCLLVDQLLRVRAAAAAHCFALETCLQKHALEPGWRPGCCCCCNCTTAPPPAGPWDAVTLLPLLLLLLQLKVTLLLLLLQ